MQQLQNKVAYSTGSASGIGKQIATVFARAGAAVVIADLNPGAAENTAAELRAGGARRARRARLRCSSLRTGVRRVVAPCLTL